MSQSRSFVNCCAILIVLGIGLAGVLAALGYLTKGSAGALSALAAVGICLAAELLACMIQVRFRHGAEVVFGTLIGMFARMFIPLIGCVAIAYRGGLSGLKVASSTGRWPRTSSFWRAIHFGFCPGRIKPSRVAQGIKDRHAWLSGHSNPLDPGHLFDHVKDSTHFEVPAAIAEGGRIEIPQPFQTAQPIVPAKGSLERV